MQHRFPRALPRVGRVTQVWQPDLYRSPMGYVILLKVGDRIGIEAGDKVIMFTATKVTPRRVWLETGVRIDRAKIVVWIPSQPKT